MVSNAQGKQNKTELLSEAELQAMLTWDAIKWRKVERYVYKLQKRIYQASQCGDVRKVRMLQKTLLRSGSNRLLSVRRVSQDNRGKKTAGIDGVSSISSKDRIDLVNTLKLTGKSKPTRRVWIPKANGEKRPLGIPTMTDRATQALVKNVVEPEWEAKFEANSYGFRPGRSCHDAIKQIKVSIQHKDKYVLDADIAKCFDRINHDKLLAKLGYSGIIRKQIKSWLKAGVIDEQTFAETDMGTPQGGVISPLLANIALHGMETEVRKCVNKGMVAQWELNFIRYADDFVIMHKDKKVILKCKEVVNTWLNDIGLELKPEKTRLTHTLEASLSEDGKAGFNFLGFNIQQHVVGKHQSSRNTHKQLTGFITLITPTKEKCKSHQEKLGEIIRKAKAEPQIALISKLNPVIRGWANFYQHSDIKSVGESGQQDYLTYLKLRRWAKRRCKNKSSVGYAKYWHKRSYTLLNGKKSMRVEFSTGPKPEDADLAKHGDIECSSIKYVKVKGDRSYYDGDFIYWGTRLGKHPETNTRVATLLKKQKGKCTKCGHYFTSEDVIEVDHIIPKAEGGKDEYKNLQLLHGHCHDTKTKEDSIRVRENKEENSNPELKLLKARLDTVEIEIKRRKGLKLSEVNKTQIERLGLVKTDLINEIKSVRKEMKSLRDKKPQPKAKKPKGKGTKKPDKLDLIIIEKERQQLEKSLKVKLP